MSLKITRDWNLHYPSCQYRYILEYDFDQDIRLTDKERAYLVLDLLKILYTAQINILSKLDANLSKPLDLEDLFVKTWSSLDGDYIYYLYKLQEVFK